MSQLVAEIEFPSSVEYVALARGLVTSLASGSLELSDDRVDDLKLAISEACTNAIEAHLAIDAKSGVVVRFYQHPEAIEIFVDDHGSGIADDAVILNLDIDDPERELHHRGLGIPLIKTLVDEAEFIPTNQGTSVRMVMNSGPRPMSE